MRYFTVFTATGEKCGIAIRLDDNCEISHKYLQLLCDFGMGSENRHGIKVLIFLFHQTSPNSSISSSTPTLTCTPVAALRTPRAKRPALGYTPSFSAADLTNL